MIKNKILNWYYYILNIKFTPVWAEVPAISCVKNWPNIGTIKVALSSNLSPEFDCEIVKLKIKTRNLINNILFLIKNI